MVRKQVYVEARHEEMLKRAAAELGVSEAELVRRGIERVCQRRLFIPPNEQAWQELEGYIRQRRSMDVPQTGRGWTRDELYDERIERLSR